MTNYIILTRPQLRRFFFHSNHQHWILKSPLFFVLPERSILSAGSRRKYLSGSGCRFSPKIASLSNRGPRRDDEKASRKLENRIGESKKSDALETFQTMLSATTQIFRDGHDAVQKFNNGISKLKSDFKTSLHIQEAELTRLHLQRILHREREELRVKLRQHEKRGIKILDENGRQIAYHLSSELYSHHENNCSSGNENNLRIHFQDQLPWRYYKEHYLSTRRPQEHLRQMSRDLRITLPTVAGFVFIPLIGYAFLLLGVMFPRWLLSRQFHSWEQRWGFAEKEYGERRKWMIRLNGDFWGSFMIKAPNLVLRNGEDSGGGTNARNDYVATSIDADADTLTCVDFDSAGPVFGQQSIKILYNRCWDLCGINNNLTLPINRIINGKVSPFIHLPTAHLHSLSLASNFSSSLFLPSSTVAPWFLQTFMPAAYLHMRLNTLAEDIIVDDAALIEEGQLENGCKDMTDDEILDACWVRGLPVGRFARARTSDRYRAICDEKLSQGDMDAMREIFSNHLKMVKLVMSYDDRAPGLLPRGELVRDPALRLLVLHLPAIRSQNLTKLYQYM